MRTLSLATVQPSNIEVPLGIGDTAWRCRNTEHVAYSILMICQRAGEWLSFTWAQYCEWVRYTPKPQEQAFLDRLVEDKALRKRGGAYTPTNRFIKVLKTYIKEASEDETINIPPPNTVTEHAARA